MSFLNKEVLSWCWPQQHVDLLSQFVRRQVLARYRGTLLGVGWSLITPLIMMAVYTFVFRYVFQMRWSDGSGGGIDFALHLFAGLAVFNFFAEVISRSPSLILEQPNLVKKVRFPVEILSWVNVLSSLLFALPALGLLLLACAVFGPGPQWAWASIPLIWLPMIPLLLGLVWMLSAVGVYVRDIGQVLGLALSLIQFLSPVFYPLSAVSPQLRVLLYLNPLTPVIEQTRAALFLNAWPALEISIIQIMMSVIIMVLGALIFRRLRPGFADVL